MTHRAAPRKIDQSVKSVKEGGFEKRDLPPDKGDLPTVVVDPCFEPPRPAHEERLPAVPEHVGPVHGGLKINPMRPPGRHTAHEDHRQTNGFHASQSIGPTPDHTTGPAVIDIFLTVGADPPGTFYAPFTPISNALIGTVSLTEHR